MSRPEIVLAIEAGSGRLWHGHTYMGHAVACAAALEVLNVIDEEKLMANVASKGEALATLLKDRFGQHPHIGDIRGVGLLRALEFVVDRATKQPFENAAGIAGKVQAAAERNGLLCYPSCGCADGTLGDHVILAPPYDVTGDQLDLIGAVLEQTFDEVFA